MGWWLNGRLDLAWRQARRRSRIVRIGPDPTPAALHREWTACVETVRAVFSAHYGADAVAQRFDVPAAYSAFITRYGGNWRWPDGLVQDLFSAGVMASKTSHDFTEFVVERDDSDGEHPDTGLWLVIAHYSDKHDILLCCDRAHPWRGQVVDFHDSHPWLYGMHEGSMRLGRSFLGWLQALGGSD